MANTVTGYLGKALDQGREVLALGVVQPFKIVTATQNSYVWIGDAPDPDNIPTPGDILIIANANNLGWVRVSVDSPVSTDNYVPLYGKDVLGMPGVHIHNLHLLFERNTDKIHLVYTQED